MCSLQDRGQGNGYGCWERNDLSAFRTVMCHIYLGYWWPSLLLHKHSLVVSKANIEESRTEIWKESE